MADYFTTVASQLGVSVWLIVVILVWEGVWKLLALWKSARKGSIPWFIALAVFNTIGILPILYIFVFSKMEPKKKAKKKKMWF